MRNDQKGELGEPGSALSGQAQQPIATQASANKTGTAH